MGCARPCLFLEPPTYGVPRKGEKCLSICLLSCHLHNRWTEFNKICWVTYSYKWSVQEYIYFWVTLHIGPQKGIKSVQLFVCLPVMLSPPKLLDWVQPNVLNVTCLIHKWGMLEHIYSPPRPAPTSGPHTHPRSLVKGQECLSIRLSIMLSPPKLLGRLQSDLHTFPFLKIKATNVSVLGFGMAPPSTAWF